MFKKIFIILFLVSISVWFFDQMKAEEQVQVQKKPPLQELKRPDIILEKITITSEPAESGKVKVMIDYTIFNDSSVSTSCCPTEEGKQAWEKNPIWNLTFPVIVEMRLYPHGRYREIERSGQILHAHKKGTLHTVEYLPEGKRYEFRARVDPENWINEKNEDNNEKTKVWPQFVMKK